jgi:transcriptional regulator with XRE-family HTH domain
MNIGTAIKSMRIKLAITQNELAYQCRVSQSTLSRIESGRKVPAQNTTARICAVLSVPETMLHIMGIQEDDVADSKKHAYRIIHPVIELLALQIARSNRKQSGLQKAVQNTVAAS